MTPSQRAFLEDEFFQLTLGAAMQRGGVYRPKLTERERRPVHTTLREVLESLLPQYAGGGVGDDVHHVMSRYSRADGFGSATHRRRSTCT